MQPGQTTQQNQRMAAEKEKMADDLKKLERQMSDTARQTREAQPGSSSKLREALGEMQQNELGLRMRRARSGFVKVRA